MNPIISVIIPNYNHSNFLRDRIESVLNQTFTDFELIILDDCSPDHGASRDIIESYRNNAHVSNIVYNDTNSGSTFKQWNKGFELAQGKYIWIAESDDSADITFLQTALLKIQQNEDAVLVFSQSNSIDPDNVISARNSKGIWAKDFVMDGQDFVRKYLLGANHICNASAVLFRHDVLNGMSQDYLSYKCCGDRLFWSLLCLEGKVCYIAEPLNNCRVHPNKVSFTSVDTGLSIREDFSIYQTIQEKINISKYNKLLINGYHYRFISAYDKFEPGVKKSVMELWSKTSNFSQVAAVVYWMSLKFGAISRKANRILPFVRWFFRKAMVKIVNKIILKRICSKQITKPYDSTFKVLYFVGSRGVEYLNASIYSLRKNFDAMPEVLIFTDGTGIREIQKKMYHLGLKVKYDTWKTAADYFRSKGNDDLACYAENELWGKKYISILYCMEVYGNVLYNDTDILWYNQPQLTFQANKLAMSSDAVESFSHPMLAKFGLTEILQYPMNAGCIYGSGTMDQYPEYKEICRYLHYSADNRTEQTSFAIFAHKYGKRLSFDQIYMDVEDNSLLVNDKSLYNKIWARHYVNMKEWVLWRDFYSIVW